MKKQILNTIGLAVAAALFCVTCSDNGLTKNPNSEAGDANALTGKFYGKDNPTDPCVANPAPGCSNYCPSTQEGCPGYVDPCVANPTPGCSNYCPSTQEGCPGYVDPCVANPTPGCSNYCPSTQEGCPGYNPCIANPNAEGCQPEIGTFTDSRTGRSYKKVTIGTQTWMAENLNYGATNSKCYDNDQANCDKYGRLYNWSTAMNGAQSSDRSPSGVQGVCPPGWHLPSSDEWMTLTNYVGYNAGTKLKSSTGWNSSNRTPVGTDEYGFSALPGGYGFGYQSGGFYTVGNYGIWWSATENSVGNALFRRMYYDDETVTWQNVAKTSLYSVRCVQN